MGKSQTLTLRLNIIVFFDYIALFYIRTNMGKTLRCSVKTCNKKLSLVEQTIGKCNCNHKVFFCSTHRYPDKHECTFDHKKEIQNRLAKNNPLIVADKVLQI